MLGYKGYSGILYNIFYAENLLPIKANLSQGKDAKLKGLKYGSQLPKIKFFRRPALLAKFTTDIALILENYDEIYSRNQYYYIEEN